MEVISTDQSTFLPVQFILDNIFLTHETIHHAKQSVQFLIFMKLDFSQAYDKIDLRCLFSAMGLMGFSQDFISMTQLLFCGAKARVNINDCNTEYFTVCQGVRQGCPLAPYLFLIGGEIFSFCIKKEVQA
jgi:hypothetical protein